MTLPEIAMTSFKRSSLSVLCLLLLAACAGKPRITTDPAPGIRATVTPAATQTSVFDPLITPTSTQIALQVPTTPILPTPGIPPDLEYAPLASGEGFTPSSIVMFHMQSGWAALESI